MATDRALIPPLQLGLRILAALGLGGIAAAVTAADSYPNRPIRFVTAAVGGSGLGFVLFRLAGDPGPAATAAVAALMLAGMGYVLTRPS